MRMGRIFKPEVPGQHYEAVLNDIPLLNDMKRRCGSYCQKCFRPLTPRSEWWTYRKDLSVEAQRAILHLVPKAKDAEEEYMYCFCADCKRYYMQVGIGVLEVDRSVAGGRYGTRGSVLDVVRGGAESSHK